MAIAQPAAPTGSGTSTTIPNARRQSTATDITRTTSSRSTASGCSRAARSSMRRSRVAKPPAPGRCRADPVEVLVFHLQDPGVAQIMAPDAISEAEQVGELAVLFRRRLRQEFARASLQHADPFAEHGIAG